MKRTQRGSTKRDHLRRCGDGWGWGDNRRTTLWFIPTSPAISISPCRFIRVHRWLHGPNRNEGNAERRRCVLRTHSQRTDARCRRALPFRIPKSAFRIWLRLCCSKSFVCFVGEVRNLGHRCPQMNTDWGFSTAGPREWLFRPCGALSEREHRFPRACARG